jgi:hypothetical protein
MADDPKKKGRDSKTISNQPHELKYAAKKAGVKPADVKQAKENTGSTKRGIIEKELAKAKKR